MRQLQNAENSFSSPPRETHGIGAARFASWGLTAVLILLALFAFWSALTTYQAGTAAKHFSELSDAFESARFAVASEESLERKYRLEPSAEVRGLHQAASDALQAALARARVISDRSDAALISDVLAMHEEYLLAINHMFAAIDAGNTTLANQIDETEVDPRFAKMEERVNAASDAHHTESIRHLDELASVQKSVLFATPVVFAIGLGLVVFFWLVLRSQRRRADQAMKNETTAVTLLRTWACDQGQGYFFSRPLDKAGLTELLRTRDRINAAAQAA